MEASSSQLSSPCKKVPAAAATETAGMVRKRAESKAEPFHVLLVHLWSAVSCISHAALLPSSQPRKDVEECEEVLLQDVLEQGEESAKAASP